jgi:hypothetical protein
MAEPIKGVKCARPFNPTFKACPFCNAPVSGPPAGHAAPAGPLTCRRCGKPFNASFATCPFCGAPAAAHTAPTRHDYAAIAEQAIAINRPFVPLEYHPAALVALDAFFDITWGEAGVAPNNEEWLPNESQWKAIVAFGCFFGELLRRAYGGEWEDDPEHPDHLVRAKVALRNGVRALPVNRAFKRMREGASQEFFGLYRALAQHAGAEIRRPGIDGWLRQAQHFEVIQRPDLALRFYEHAMAIASDTEKLAMLGRMSAAALAARQLRERQ